jgi:hypothetical protein
MALSKNTADKATSLKYPTEDATDEQKAEWTYARYETQDPLYLTFEKQWSENIAFIRGRQWDRWDPHTLRMVPDTQVPPWRERLVDNYTFAIWKTIVAKLTKNRPAWDVRPASGDPVDIHAARLARNVLEWLWSVELDMAAKWRRAVSWVGSTGNVWCEVWWDPMGGGLEEMAVEWPIQTENGLEIIKVAVNPETGEPMVDPMTGAPLIDPDTGVPFEPPKVPRGQVEMSVHPPYAVRVNPEAFSNPENLTDAMVAHTVSKVWFERVYGKEAADAIVWGEDHALTRIESELEQLASGGHKDAGHQVVGTPSSMFKGETVVLTRHYHMPSPDFPEGRYWVAAPTGVLIEPEQPLPLGVWPLVHIPAYDNPGLFLSPAPIEPIIPLNRRLNHQNSRIAEHEKIMMRGKWLVPKGAGLAKGAITSMPGEVIEHMPGFIPIQANIKALPAAVYNERQTTKEDIQFVSGVHKISLGQPPPGVTAGRAFLVLQEADDTDLGPILSSLSDGLAKLGYLMLWFVRHMYDEQRMIAVSGTEQGEWLYTAFMGDDLDPNGIGQLAFQVKVQEGSMFPWSKAAAQEMAIQLMNTPVGQALMMDEAGGLDKSALSRILQVGGLENLVHATDLDVAEGERVYNDLITGKGLPQPMPWQALEVHIEVFENHFKQANFHALPPEVQDVAFQYWGLMQETVTAQVARAQSQAIDMESDMIEDVTYAEEHAKHQAEVDVKGKPVMNNPNKKK